MPIPPWRLQPTPKPKPKATPPTKPAVCMACEGTGRNSNNRPCYPCDGTGRRKARN